MGLVGRAAHLHSRDSFSVVLAGLGHYSEPVLGHTVEVGLLSRHYMKPFLKEKERGEEKGRIRRGERGGERGGEEKGRRVREDMRVCVVILF